MARAAGALRPARIPACLALLLLLGVTAWPQERDFYQDVGGYHAQGEAVALDRAEAIRLAKAAALRHLFEEIGKDALFAEMCISGWPEHIRVEEQTESAAEGGHAVRLRVVVAAGAIVLTEQKYQVAAAALLDSMETALAEAEKDLVEAEGLERNLEAAGALGSYRRARSRAAEARELVRDVGDKSVTSAGGSTVTALVTRLDALSVRITGGLERMEAIEREAQKSAIADEMAKAYDLYAAALEEVEERAGRSRELAPYYDLPRSQLDSVLLDLRADLGRLDEIATGLEGLRGTVATDRQYLRQKVELSLLDARSLEERLREMEGEVRQEIRLPRLARQERAQRARSALQGLGKAASWTFLHRPRDIVTLEWELPLRWDMERPLEATGEADLRLEAEGAFGWGLWIRGTAAHEDVVDAAGVETWRSSAWTSQFDIGLGRKTVLGVGLVWDWERRSGIARMPRELGVRLHVGGIDQERGRALWLLSLGYALPLTPTTVVVLPYYLNASLDLRVKAGDILILSAELLSKCYQFAALDSGGVFTDAFGYRLGWRVGAALRLPPPFMLGIGYGGELCAGIAPDGRLETPDAYWGGWSLSLGYAF